MAANDYGGHFPLLTNGGGGAHVAKPNSAADPPPINELVLPPAPDTGIPSPRSPRTDAVRPTLAAATLERTDSPSAGTSPRLPPRVPSRSSSNRSDRGGGDSAFVRAARRQSLSQRVARGGGGLAKRLRAVAHLVARRRRPLPARAVGRDVAFCGVQYDGTGSGESRPSHAQRVGPEPFARRGERASDSGSMRPVPRDGMKRC